MDTIRVIHDVVGITLTLWWDDPRKEHLCAETTDEGGDPNLAVATVVRTKP